jgi:hypothetical protein
MSRNCGSLDISHTSGPQRAVTGTTYLIFCCNTVREIMGSPDRGKKQHRKKPPGRRTIYSWHKNFVEAGCSVCHAKSPGELRSKSTKVNAT